MICPDCSSQPRTPAHRLARATGAVTPGIVLALMPKCPMCVAGYVAAATGVSISFTAAWYLRAAVIALCVAAMLGLLLTLAPRRDRTPISRRRPDRIAHTHRGITPDEEPHHDRRP